MLRDWICQGFRLKVFKNALFALFSGHVRPRQGTEICNFGAPSPLEALHWIFCFFSSIYVQFSKTSPPKSGENSEKSSGESRVKSCHVCGCHGFFGPEPPKTPRIFYPSLDPCKNPRKQRKRAENTRSTKEFPWLEQTTQRTLSY